MLYFLSADGTTVIRTERQNENYRASVYRREGANYHKVNSWQVGFNISDNLSISRSGRFLVTIDNFNDLDTIRILAVDDGHDITPKELKNLTNITQSIPLSRAIEFNLNKDDWMIDSALISPDDSYLAILARLSPEPAFHEGTSYLVIWDLLHGRTVKIIGDGDWLTDYCFNPKSTYAAVGSEYGLIQTVNLSNGKSKKFSLGGSSTSLAMGPNGLIVSYAEGGVLVHDFIRNVDIAHLPFTNSGIFGDKFTFSEDGEYVSLDNIINPNVKQDFSLRVWSLKPHDLLKEAQNRLNFFRKIP